MTSIIYPVDQLKKISNALRTRILHIHHTSVALSGNTRPTIAIYAPPKSGAKKAEWVSALAAYFNSHGASNDNFYDLLNGGTNVAGAGSSSAAHSVVRPPPAASTIPSSTTNVPGNYPPVAQTARSSLANVSTNNPSSVGASARMSPPKKSPKKKISKKSPPKVGHGTTTSIHATATTATTLHGSTHHQYPPYGYNPFLPQNNPAMATTTSVPDPGAGLKRAATTSPVRRVGPKQSSSNVNRQPVSQTTSTSQSNQSSTIVRTATLTAGTNDDSSTPRDFRERAMLAHLTQMGFTNTLEILTALRAVVDQRVENCSSSAGGTAEWSQQEQVEAAMTWIVTQREEAAFARELDRARILSEQENAIQEQSRKQRMAQEVEHASVVELLGTAEGRSRHFPHSVLLRNRPVKSVLNSVVSGSSHGKKQVIRLLNLELKARKWYGTVMPYSYFEYVLCPSFGSWAGESAQFIAQKVEQVSDKLEKAMFNLSEQVEGGIGSVPKLFYDAQTNASREGKPISVPEESEVINDDDDDVIEVVEQPLRSSSSSSTCATGCSEVRHSEVINIA